MNPEFNAKAQRPEDAGELNSFVSLGGLAALRLCVEFQLNHFTITTHH
jgi:hypothetical protein